MELGCGGVKGAELKSVGMMLRGSVWREVKWKWEVEPQEQSKLGVMQRLLVHGSEEDVGYAERRYCCTES